MGYWDSRRTSGSGMGNSQQNYGGWGQSSSYVPRDPAAQSGFGQGQTNSAGETWHGPDQGISPQQYQQNHSQDAFVNWFSQSNPEMWQQMLNNDPNGLWAQYNQPQGIQQPNQNMAGNIVGSMMQPQGY